MNASQPLPVRAGLALATVVLAALAPDPADTAAEARWLQQCRTRAGDAAEDPLGFLRDWIHAPGEADRGLHELARMLGLATAEVIALALVAEVERDPMAGRAVAWLQTPVGGSRPTLGLLAAVAARIEKTEPALALALLASGRAVAAGVLRWEAEQRTLPESTLRMPAPLALALAGLPSSWPGVQSGLPDPPLLPPSVGEQAARLAATLGGDGGALVIRSGYAREARAAAALFARTLGAQPAYFSDEPPPAGIGAWLWLTGHIPVFAVEMAPGETRNLKPLPGYPGPVLVLSGIDGSLRYGDMPATRWELAIPACEERIALWQAATGDPLLSARLGREHRLPAARIEELARAGQREARLQGGALDPQTVAAAARGSGAIDLGHLAQLRPQVVEDEALVLAPPIRQSLEQLLARCRHRDGLAEPLGPAVRARYRPGVRALFVGPSGTGKSLAAVWMATRLGLPLYHVDLASVASKYIGETEKNLAQLFERAEHANVVLLFDEADALFGKRTDVRDANDRYANNQTNYLLQRIEAFDGLAILTSNSRSRFDSAFSRRLDAIIEFPAPAAGERRALWLAHLGGHHRLGPADLNQLAGACDLAGGHIRNAVLAATAASDGPVDFAGLRQAVEAEYRKLGRGLPTGLGG